RRFCSSSTSPSCSAATAFPAVSPTQSSANATDAPSSCSSGPTTGFRLIEGTRLPFGRSKWLIRITFAPPARSLRMVGNAASSRVSSLTLPSCSGTLKSTRTSARLPFTSTPSSVRKPSVTGIVLAQLAQRHGDVGHPRGETPLVVVPAEHPHQPAVDHLGLRQRRGRRGGDVVEVD